MAEYEDCFYCGGKVTEKYLPREIWWESRLHIIENVPMGVCTQCGEKVLKPNVAKQIDSFLMDKGMPMKTMEVPVYEFEESVA